MVSEHKESIELASVMGWNCQVLKIAIFKNVSEAGHNTLQAVSFLIAAAGTPL